MIQEALKQFLQLAISKRNLLRSLFLKFSSSVHTLTLTFIFRTSKRCEGDKTLTIACSDDLSSLELKLVLLTLDQSEQMFNQNENHGLVGLQTGQRKPTYTPFCKGSESGFEDRKALGLCQSLGFSCGMESRHHQLNISSTFDNLG